MPSYVLDTNVFIRAARDATFNDELNRFLSANTPAIHLHSVVAGELLAGALAPALKRRIEADLIAPYERRNRVLTPTHRAWKEANSVLASLRGDGHVSANGITPSFANDCLIAASARDFGFTLVTANLKDFERLGRYLPIRITPPWP